MKGFKRVGPPIKESGSKQGWQQLWDIIRSLIMKEIIYKGKKIKVPFEDADYRLDGEQDVTIQNPFSGEKTTVPGYAAAVYDVIMGAQVTHNYDLVQKGCDWFSRNFPKQYMVLLD